MYPRAFKSTSHNKAKHAQPLYRPPNILFVMTDFHGWDAGAAWEDMKLGLEHFADIERLAMVGEKKWQHGMATFCKPFTKATIQYFDDTDVAKARKWLGMGNTKLEVE